MKKQGITVIGSNPIQSIKFPQNPDQIQSNSWMDPIHVQLCDRPQYILTNVIVSSYNDLSVHSIHWNIVGSYSLCLLLIDGIFEKHVLAIS